MKSPAHTIRAAHDTGYEYRILALTCAGFALVGLRYWLSTALYSRIMIEFGLSDQQMHGLLLAYAIPSLSSLLIMGPLSDRLGRKKLLIGALAAFSLLSSLTWMAGSFPALLVIQASMGIILGALIPASVAVVNQASAPARRGLNLGLLISMSTLFGITPASVALSPDIAPSWNWALASFAIPGLIVTVLMVKALTRATANNAQTITTETPARPAAAPQAAPQATHWAAYFRAHNVWLGVLAAGCVTVGLITTNSAISDYFVNVLHLDLQSIRFIMPAAGLGGFCGFVIPALSDHSGRQRAAMVSFVLLAVLVYTFHACSTVEPSFTLLFMLTFALFFVANGILGLLVGPIATEGAPSGLSASAVGLVMGVGSFFGGIVSAIIKPLAGYYGSGVALWITICVLALGAAASFFLVETAPRKARSAGSVRNDFTK